MEKIRYCNNCGALLKDNAKFCGMCGAPVEPVLMDQDITVHDAGGLSASDWQDPEQMTQTLGLGDERSWNEEGAGTQEADVQDSADSYWQPADSFRKSEDMNGQFGGCGDGAAGHRYTDDQDPDFQYDQMPDGGNQNDSWKDKLQLIIVGIVLAILVVILVLLIYRRMGPSAGESNNQENAGDISTVTQSREEAVESGDTGEVQEETNSEEGTADDSNIADTEESGSDNTVTGSGSSKGETAAETGTQTETGTETQNSGYILPDSASRVYSRSEIEALTDTELLYALNEIYARHGRIFKDEQIREYFESQSWYHGTVSGETFDPTQDQVFNTYEKQNRDLITDVMEERGLR